MTHHRQSYVVGEMAMPLMETPEQQENMNLKEKLELNQIEIIELKEQLNQEKKDHQETKSRLETAEIKLSDRASEVEGLRNIIQSLVIQDQASYKKIQQSNNFESKTESTFQMMKMEFDKKFDDFKLENDKKFDDLKEQISKGKEQEGLQKLMETNINMKKELSDVVDKLGKKDLEFEELKKKYEEAVVKLDDMNKLQIAMKDLKLKHQQLQQQLQQQQQQQQQQQLDKKTADHQSPIDDLSRSKELNECLSVHKKFLDAYLKNSDLKSNLFKEYNRQYFNLSKEDQEKCKEIGRESYDDYLKKKNNSQ